MDIFVKKLSDNKGIKFFFAFTIKDFKDVSDYHRKKQQHPTDFVEELIKSAPKFLDDEKKTVDYFFTVNSGQLLEELIVSDFKGRLSPYEMVYVICLYENHSSNVKNKALGIISDIADVLSRSSVMVEKYLINAL